MRDGSAWILRSIFPLESLVPVARRDNIGLALSLSGAAGQPEIGILFVRRKECAGSRADQFMARYNMDADFGGVHWTVNLIGSSRATSAMAQCVAAAEGGLTS